MDVGPAREAAAARARGVLPLAVPVGPRILTGVEASGESATPMTEKRDAAGVTGEWARSGPRVLRFASTSELRDALLEALTGLPVPDLAWIPLDPSGNDEHAWAWLGRLIRRRGDWRDAAGVALQHAVTEGGELARVAFADLVACDRSLVAIERYVAPLAARWPDVRVTRSDTGWGRSTSRTPRLADVMRDRAELVAALASDAGPAAGAPTAGSPATERDLREEADEQPASGPDEDLAALC